MPVFCAWHDLTSTQVVSRAIRISHCTNSSLICSGLPRGPISGHSLTAITFEGRSDSDSPDSFPAENQDATHSEPQHNLRRQLHLHRFVSPKAVMSRGQSKKQGKSSYPLFDEGSPRGLKNQMLRRTEPNNQIRGFVCRGRLRANRRVVLCGHRSTYVPHWS